MYKKYSLKFFSFIINNIITYVALQILVNIYSIKKNKISNIFKKSNWNVHINLIGSFLY